MKPMLKAPGTKRLKLQYDEPPSNFAFNSNLRRYTSARATLLFQMSDMREVTQISAKTGDETSDAETKKGDAKSKKGDAKSKKGDAKGKKAGAYTRPLFSPT
jgi:hypothetical protein